MDKAIVTGLGSINRGFSWKDQYYSSLCGFVCICDNMGCMVAPFIESHVADIKLFDLN